MAPTLGAATLSAKDVALQNEGAQPFVGHGSVDAQNGSVIWQEGKANAVSLWCGDMFRADRCLL